MAKQIFLVAISPVVSVTWFAVQGIFLIIMFNRATLKTIAFGLYA